MSDLLSRIKTLNIKRELKAGHELKFSPVNFSGEPRLSHTILYRRGRYHLKDADGNLIGHYRTFVAADRAGLAASAEPIP